MLEQMQLLAFGYQNYAYPEKIMNGMAQSCNFASKDEVASLLHEQQLLDILVRFSAINDPQNPFERRRVLVVATYGDDALKGAAHYTVKNLEWGPPA